MSKRGSLESLLEKAKNREKEYAWLEAVELYKQAFGGSPFSVPTSSGVTTTKAYSTLE